jgi:signal transduction histidine kinase
VMLLAAAGGWWISGRALAPVDRMTRAVQAISRRNLDQRLDVPGADDEVRRLAVTFNDMLIRLHTSVADMVRFTAEAAHELRTPVSLVRTTAEVSLAKDRPAPAYREALADVLDQAERMSILVNDLLTLARADAGVEAEEMRPVDLRVIAELAAHEIRAAAARRCLAFETDLSDAVEVRGNRESLRRLMLILLDNAIKYTPPGGSVRLRVSSEQSPRAEHASGIIDVIDTGHGIDLAEGPHIFERFYRGATARQQTDGSGLGLSIARAIVERHRGSIAVNPGGDGRGCHVVVRL